MRVTNQKPVTSPHRTEIPVGRGNQRGVVLILTFIILTTLTAIVVAFLSLTSIQTKVGGYDISSHKALWLAEAGLQKVVWNLMTPVGSGGQGENWTTTGTTEDLGAGTYTMVVERWNFALADNGASATATSSKPGSGPARAIDGNNNTRWQSNNVPSSTSPESITITFPYRLTINKVRFFLASQFSQNRPKDYSWQVSTDGTSFTTVATVANNNNTDVTDTFTAASNVNYLRLEVTATGGTNKDVMIATLEAIGSKITSTGTVSSLNRKIAQTVVADDATQTASDEIDWNEIVPAI